MDLGPFFVLTKCANSARNIVFRHTCAGLVPVGTQWACTFADGEEVRFTRVMECVAGALFAMLLSLVGCCVELNV